MTYMLYRKCYFCLDNVQSIGEYFPIKPKMPGSFFAPIIGILETQHG
jgi:hypothetical protein